MSEAMVEAMEALTALMDEECTLLKGGVDHQGVAAIAAAKQKLTARLEAQTVFLDREEPGWRERLSPEMLHLTRQMQQSAARNAAMLRRQIELSRDLLDAIAAEAQRLTGLRVDTYGDQGAISRFDQPAPLAINARA
ncbi:flagellar protein FlgN [Sphingomonas ginkgonis]|uniref:Flagellar protein FlgN n=1 Tax=Sphingomonas ginkgonis TaxID=2315330 RepID=A0A3R9Z667_9SPHN|nr:flagellar protein FlgN [Sphingomonas ginkgonis]RST30715.1 flagellar protein FlgN [Sphingomonas ginkgonis]